MSEPRMQEEDKTKMWVGSHLEGLGCHAVLFVLYSRQWEASEKFQAGEKTRHGLWGIRAEACMLKIIPNQREVGFFFFITGQVKTK